MVPVTYRQTKRACTAADYTNACLGGLERRCRRRRRSSLTRTQRRDTCPTAVHRRMTPAVLSGRLGFNNSNHGGSCYAGNQSGTRAVLLRSNEATVKNRSPGLLHSNSATQGRVSGDQHSNSILSAYVERTLNVLSSDRGSSSTSVAVCGMDSATAVTSEFRLRVERSDFLMRL